MSFSLVFNSVFHPRNFYILGKKLHKNLKDLTIQFSLQKWKHFCTTFVCTIYNFLQFLLGMNIFQRAFIRIYIVVLPTNKIIWSLHNRNAKRGWYKIQLWLRVLVHFWRNQFWREIQFFTTNLRYQQKYPALVHRSRSINFEPLLYSAIKLTQKNMISMIEYQLIIIFRRVFLCRNR